jgi:hypothetical protein
VLQPLCLGRRFHHLAAEQHKTGQATISRRINQNNNKSQRLHYRGTSFELVLFSA